LFGLRQHKSISKNLTSLFGIHSFLVNEKKISNSFASNLTSLRSWQISPLHAQIYALGEDSASASRRTRNLSISFSPVREARQSPPARAKKPVDLLLLTPPLPRARPRAADSARSLPPRAVAVAPPSRPRRFRFPRLRRRPWTPQM